MIPKILKDIEEALSNEKITISESVEGEGRAGSLYDEGNIIRYLKNHPKFSDYIISVPARGFGDMLVKDYNLEDFHVVNIKTNSKSSDNATSKLGILWAFTNIPYEELPKSMSWKVFLNLLKNNKDNSRDYWFLAVDKEDSSIVTVRGCKQIVNWVENSNPSNLLQINWNKEHICDPAIRTYDEAYEVVVNGILRCYTKGLNKLPLEWIKLILNSLINNHQNELK